MSGSKHVLGSDLAKVDAHTITDAEYEEIPELDDAWFERARLIRRGDPADPAAIPLDSDLRARFEATGPGWQSRINQILREWAETNLAPSQAD